MASDTELPQLRKECEELWEAHNQLSKHCKSHLTTAKPTKEELAVEFRGVKGKKENLEERYARYVAECQDGRRRVQDVEESCKKMEAEIQGLKKVVQLAEESCQKNDMEIQDLRNKAQDFKESSNRKDVQIQDLKDDAQTAKQDSESKDAHIKNLRNNARLAEETSAKKGSEIQALKVDVQQKQDRIVALQDRHNDTSKKLEDCEGRLATARQLIAENDSRIQWLGKENGGITSNEMKLKSTVDGLQAQLISTDEAIKELQRKHEAEIETFKKAGINSEIEELLRAKLSDAISLAKIQEAEFKKQLEVHIKNAAEEREKLKGDLDRSKVAITLGTDQFAECQRKYHAEVKKLEELGEELKEFQKRLTETTKAAAAKDNDHKNRLRVRMGEKVTEITAKNQEISDLQNRLVEVSKKTPSASGTSNEGQLKARIAELETEFGSLKDEHKDSLRTIRNLNKEKFAREPQPTDSIQSGGTSGAPRNQGTGTQNDAELWKQNAKALRESNDKVVNDHKAALTTIEVLTTERDQYRDDKARLEAEMGWQLTLDKTVLKPGNKTPKRPETLEEANSTIAQQYKTIVFLRSSRPDITRADDLEQENASLKEQLSATTVGCHSIAGGDEAPNILQEAPTTCLKEPGFSKEQSESSITSPQGPSPSPIQGLSLSSSKDPMGKPLEDRVTIGGNFHQPGSRGCFFNAQGKKQHYLVSKHGDTVFTADPDAPRKVKTKKFNDATKKSADNGNSIENGEAKTSDDTSKVQSKISLQGSTIEITLTENTEAPLSVNEIGNKDAKRPKEPAAMVATVTDETKSKATAAGKEIAIPQCTVEKKPVVAQSPVEEKNVVPQLMMKESTVVPQPIVEEKAIIQQFMEEEKIALPQPTAEDLDSARPPVNEALAGTLAAKSGLPAEDPTPTGTGLADIESGQGSHEDVKSATPEVIASVNTESKNDSHEDTKHATPATAESAKTDSKKGSIDDTDDATPKSTRSTNTGSKKDSVADTKKATPPTTRPANIESKKTPHKETIKQQTTADDPVLKFVGLGKSKYAADDTVADSAPPTTPTRENICASTGGPHSSSKHATSSTTAPSRSTAPQPDSKRASATRAKPSAIKTPTPDTTRPSTGGPLGSSYRATASAATSYQSASTRSNTKNVSPAPALSSPLTTSPPPSAPTPETLTPFMGGLCGSKYASPAGSTSTPSQSSAVNRGPGLRADRDNLGRAGGGLAGNPPAANDGGSGGQQHPPRRGGNWNGRGGRGGRSGRGGRNSQDAPR
ncbi:hypothetical protein P154DRAFT_603557 [Amniculicola lignicola CBS 123094]|uniref:Uncharacterized protein n=1 Tax=Amniculicola lignicola CBS 123094 TaxID=1392246 RepID=A0A6A5WYT9_9PLEO|nr:hypothetical protein P154DRAFT_603557 [Amniculicola lignicola CBS 123094]